MRLTTYMAELERQRRNPPRVRRVHVPLDGGRVGFAVGKIERKSARVCAWCRETVTEGSEPATHTICTRCADAMRLD